MSRLKGHALAVTPMHPEREDHTTGVIRLLSVAWWGLTLLLISAAISTSNTAKCARLPQETKPLCA